MSKVTLRLIYLFLYTSYPTQISEIAVTFTKQLEDTTIDEEETVKLTCETSKPNVPVKWFKNGDEIVTGLHYKINGTGNQCILTVLNANLKDNNTFSCKIVSSGETTQGKLTVQGITTIHCEQKWEFCVPMPGDLIRV